MRAAIALLVLFVAVAAALVAYSFFSPASGGLRPPDAPILFLLWALAIAFVAVLREVIPAKKG